MRLNKKNLLYVVELFVFCTQSTVSEECIFSITLSCLPKKQEKKIMLYLRIKTKR